MGRYTVHNACPPPALHICQHKALMYLPVRSLLGEPVLMLLSMIKFSLPASTGPWCCFKVQGKTGLCISCSKGNWLHLFVMDTCLSLCREGGVSFIHWASFFSFLRFYLGARECDRVRMNAQVGEGAEGEGEAGSLIPGP